ncbi:unnamed protein product [Chondrus crispus]|uniref:Uncharacterized protein n=1 Tax=Chondrus crispus TaxID=2769 RepID=R7QPQ4_CHOCR|nr:unnamed protein product [Chondrus crispus]CDF39763.1 unnamed protein product [Chondrus crispus]|eukprot:XP_005710057.1 unnamed protein product [Chondrus crispus]
MNKLPLRHIPTGLRPSTSTSGAEPVHIVSRSATPLPHVAPSMPSEKPISSRPPIEVSSRPSQGQKSSRCYALAFLKRVSRPSSRLPPTSAGRPRARCA